LGSAAEACDGSGAVFHSVVNAENPSPEVKGGFSVMVNMCAIEAAAKDLLARDQAASLLTLSMYTQDSVWSCSNSSAESRNCSYRSGFILAAGSGSRYRYHVVENEGDDQGGVFSTFSPYLQEIVTAQGKYVLRRMADFEGGSPQKKAEIKSSIRTVTFTDNEGGSYTWDNISEGGDLAKGEVWIFGNIRGNLMNYTAPSGGIACRFWNIVSPLFSRSAARS